MAVASFTVSEMANKITLKIIDDLVEKAKEHSWPTARMGTTAPLIARDSAWAHALQQAQREAEFQHMASQSARMMPGRVRTTTPYVPNPHDFTFGPNKKDWPLPVRIGNWFGHLFAPKKYPK